MAGLGIHYCEFNDASDSHLIPGFLIHIFLVHFNYCAADFLLLDPSFIAVGSGCLEPYSQKDIVTPALRGC